MADYTPTTDFSAKDALPTGDPNKIIKGSDFDVEFEAIETAIATKANTSDVVLTSDIGVDVQAYNANTSIFVASSVVNAGTTHPAEFTSIPSWVKRIMININGVTTDTVATLSVQLGTASGYITSGYTSLSGTNVGAGGAFLLYGTSNAAKTGIATLTKSDSSNNTWMFGAIHHNNSTPYISTGVVVLTDVLTKLKLYTASGATAAGSVSITYE